MNIDEEREETQFVGQVVPRIDEQLEVSKSETITGDVTVHKDVQNRDVVASDTFLMEHVELERVVVNTPVEAVQPPWEEDGSLVIPVYEERLVTHKQLFLKEKIKVSKQVVASEQQKKFTLREENVVARRSTGDR